MNSDRARELIGRLAGKNQAFEGRSRICDPLTAADIAAASFTKSRRERVGWMLVWLKYANHAGKVFDQNDKYLREVKLHLLFFVVDEILPRYGMSGQRHGQGTLRGLVDAALDGELLPGWCWVCGGTGIVEAGPIERMVCDGCGGARKIKKTDAEIAKSVAVNKASFSRTWRRVYDDLIIEIQSLEHEFLSAFKRHLRGA